ncbi:Up-regulated during septation-domain-containing protein, partial [Lactarius quietus]
MNGVRRFLGNPTAAITTKDRASTSRSPSPTKELPPPPSAGFTTRGLFIRKDRKPPPPEPPNLPPELPPHPPTNGGVQPVVNTRDALLLSLMSSEAMVDSRGYEILTAEEVEELKKEQTILSSRVGALQRKLATETKIRDAAQNLARLNSSSSAPSSSTRISRQSTTALETAERKVDAAQTELWRVQERAANVSRRLLEHRAGVLAAALAAAERTQAGEEQQDNVVDGPLSPASTGSGAGALAQKFDGAHLFAGHEGAVVPAKQQPRGAQRKGLEELQARLDASEARTREREAELEDALAAAEAELEDARSAADRRAALEFDLEQEHAALERERKRATELEGRLAFLELEVESSAQGSDAAVRLEERVRALERELEDVSAEADRVRTEAEVEAEAWAVERARFEREEARWAQSAGGIEGERARWEQERDELAAQAKDQIAAAADGLRALVQRFDVPLFSRESEHAEAELLLAAEVEKRAALSNELETAKEEIQALRARSPNSRPASTHAAEPRPGSSLAFAKDASGFVAILQPLWATLPSPEARAARLSGATRPLFRAGSGRTSPSMRAGAPGSPGQSISDMDVRALKSLYTPGSGSSGNANANGTGTVPRRTPNSGTGTPGSPHSPVGEGAGTFSVEAFALRVQSLIADDRALMERLIRFAQAHDLLKKNAERAQKLAQDTQVRTLEEQLARSDGLQEQMDQLNAEKLAVEESAAEQAETLRHLTEANATLSS